MASRPLQRVQAAIAARRHFLGRQTKSQITDDLSISRFKVARLIEAAKLAAPADEVGAEVVGRLRALAAGVRVEQAGSLEELDRTLSVLEERLFAALMTAASEQELVALREQAARELAHPNAAHDIAAMAARIAGIEESATN